MYFYWDFNPGNGQMWIILYFVNRTTSNINPVNNMSVLDSEASPEQSTKPTKSKLYLYIYMYYVYQLIRH